MFKAPLALAAAAALLAACQTSPQPTGRFLSNYQGFEERSSLRASVRERRDEALLRQVERIHIEPAVLAPGAAPDISEGDKALVLGEVDRQLCYALSGVYILMPEPGVGVARVRPAVTKVTPTNPVGSGVSAVANVLIPGPLGVRAPGTTGMLAAETELVINGRQASGLIWARQANVVGVDSPSTSRVGDALQFAGEFAGAAARAFAPREANRQRPDNAGACAKYGPPANAAGLVTQFVTGVYVPGLEGVKPQERQPRTRSPR